MCEPSDAISSLNQTPHSFLHTLSRIPPEDTKRIPHIEGFCKFGSEKHAYLSRCEEGR